MPLNWLPCGVSRRLTGRGGRRIRIALSLSERLLVKPLPLMRSFDLRLLSPRLRVMSLEAGVG